MVYERFATDVSGTIVREPGGRVVLGVNTFHSKTRQRFTVAHELGHWKLHLEGGSATEGKPFGWATGYSVADGGRATFEYQTNPIRYLLLLVQALAWLVLLRRLVQIRLDPGELPAEPSTEPPPEPPGGEP